MGTRENKVEQHLDDRFSRIGGTTRKWVSPGRNGVPDRICIYLGTTWFVEVKTVDGRLSDAQEREHVRLAECGAKVRTVYGVKGVDKLMNEVMSHFYIREKEEIA